MAVVDGFLREFRLHGAMQGGTPGLARIYAERVARAAEVTGGLKTLASRPGGAGKASRRSELAEFWN